jgi:SMC interacting uncharacterized protein involved in chromosome segregation
MSRRERDTRERRTSGSSSRKERAGQQGDMVDKLTEQVRTMDSEIDLLKQKMNAMIRQINVLKRVVLSEKKEIKGLFDEQELEKQRFESMINVMRSMKEEEKQP